MPSALKIAAIVPSAGSGKRLQSSVPKQFLKVNGKPILIHTLERLISAYPFTELVVALDPLRMGLGQRLLTQYRLHDRIRLVAGGKTRSESVLNALFSLRKECNWVLVHDAARPLVQKKDVRSLIDSAARFDGAILASPATSTIKKSDNRGQFVVSTLKRDEIFLAQTPQMFRKNLLQKRYKALGKKALQATDEASLFDGTPAKIRLVEGSEMNFKITKKEDLGLYKFYLSTERKRS